MMENHKCKTVVRPESEGGWLKILAEREAFVPASIAFREKRNGPAVTWGEWVCDSLPLVNVDAYL